MNKKTISPNPQQPVERKPAGQLPNALAELTEAALTDTNALPASGMSWERPAWAFSYFSYDGDDE